VAVHLVEVVFVRAELGPEIVIVEIELRAGLGAVQLVKLCLVVFEVSAELVVVQADLDVGLDTGRGLLDLRFEGLGEITGVGRDLNVSCRNFVPASDGYSPPSGGAATGRGESHSRSR
jgi:hypothetical protein